MARGDATEQAARTSFRDVFAIAEFRALWTAQLLSVVGDQLARVALTVLVYDRTRSSLLAAVTFAVSIVPTFIGGMTLAWLADRYPRRGVMIAGDLIRFVLVLVMAIPGLPLAALVLLLFFVTLTEAPFSSARAAIYPDVLTGDRYVVGTAVTLTTYQFAQVLGFAVCGAHPVLLGAKPRRLAADPGRVGSVRVLSVGRQCRLRARGTAGTAQPSLRLRPGRDEPGSGRRDDSGGGRSGTSRCGTGHRGVRRGRRHGSGGGRGQRGPRPAGERTPAALRVSTTCRRA